MSNCDCQTATESATLADFKETQESIQAALEALVTAIGPKWSRAEQFYGQEVFDDQIGIYVQADVDTFLRVELTPADNNGETDLTHQAALLLSTSSNGAASTANGTEMRVVPAGKPGAGYRYSLQGIVPKGFYWRIIVSGAYNEAVTALYITRSN